MKPAYIMRHRRRLATLAVLAVCVCGAALVFFLQIRDASIQEITQASQQVHGGDPIDALAATATSEAFTLRDRNRAIWALGELRDELALPCLHELHVQEECDHERLVCQREVRKAIRKINGEMSPLHTLRTGLRKLTGWLGS